MKINKNIVLLGLKGKLLVQNPLGSNTEKYFAKKSRKSEMSHFRFLNYFLGATQNLKLRLNHDETIFSYSVKKS